MRRTLCLAVLFAAYLGSAHAQCAVSAGASVATIQAAINTASTGGCAGPGTNTVALAAGSYTVTSTLNLLCTVTLTGPILPYSKTHYQTAILNGSSSYAGQPIHTTAGCSTSQNIQYLEWNGHQPTNGGGFIDVVPGTTNLVINNNYIHGSNAAAYAENTNEAGILLDGVTSSPLTQNITITYNEFGAETYTDCGYPNGAMGEADTEGGGGFCAGVISQGQTKNVSIDHNIFHNIEQGAKVIEASSGHGNTQLFTFDYNDIYGSARIDFETQSNIYDTSHPTFQNIQYNSLRNRYANGQFNFDLSIANGCGNPPATTNCTAHMDYNVDIQDQSTNRGGGNEFWGDAASTANYNLLEGYVAKAIGGGITWSQSGQFNFNNNIFNLLSGGNTNCLTSASGYWSVETGNHPSGSPTCTGNTFTNVGVGTYASQAPSISPAGGTFTGSQVVTFNCSGCTNRDANTTIWYTTDGSTPVPGSGTAQPIAVGGTITLTGSATVKAVGMWGALNQPYNYPSGYGYVPSSLITATFSTSGLYISPTGNDSNSGTFASPWLTPNHAMTCGQVITAISGTYSASNFLNGNWGTVTCPGANDFAWVICQTFDTCKINQTATGTPDAMWVDQSFWAVEGFEATVSASGNTSGACFHAGPSGSSTVHHIMFVNDIANGCKGGGFNAYDRSTSASVDYIAYIGNIAWNAAQGTGACYSGLNIYQPIASDTNSGTHMYIAGNFSYDNLNAPSCDSAPAGKTTDGENINLDTFDFSQGGGTAYTQQAVVQNNIVLNGGTRSIEVENNGFAHSTAGSPIYIKFNTSYGSGIDPNMAFPAGIAEIGIIDANNVNVTNNLVYTGHQYTTGTNAYYALGMTNGSGTDTVDSNYAAGVAGNNTYPQTSPGFSYGVNNILGTNPSFASTVDPGAPNCGSFTSTAACMASVVANFTPTVTAAKAYGYQTPSNTSITDALFPQWLCTGPSTLNPNIPLNLIKPGCGGSSPVAATPVMSPTSQSFTTTLSVSVSDSTPGATMYCTTDGSTPTTGSPVYTGAFNLSATTTIKCIATATGYTQSAVGSGTYTLVVAGVNAIGSGNLRVSGGAIVQ